MVGVWDREIAGEEEAPHAGQYLASGGTGALHTEQVVEDMRQRLHRCSPVVETKGGSGGAMLSRCRPSSSPA
jgi:hypothetical protein